MTNRPRRAAPSRHPPGSVNMNSSTPQPLVVSIPHRLGREEAKRRLDAGIGRLGPELGAVVGGLDYSWNADTLNFRAAAMWQTINGRLEVLDDAVRIEIDLPWMMRLNTISVWRDADFSTRGLTSSGGPSTVSSAILRFHHGST